MSTHKVEVVRLGPVEKHPNADSLAITKIWAYTAIVRLGDFSFVDAETFVKELQEEYRVPGWFDDFNLDKLVERSMMNSIICPKQIAEGIVVKPVQERIEHVGRVALKLVSDKYLERAK